MRSGSTEWMRKGSMIVLKRSGIAAPMLKRRSVADEPDCFADPASPRLAVTGKHDVRFNGLDALERFARPREIAPERRKLRPGLPREHVQRCECVADEEHPSCG